MPTEMSRQPRQLVVMAFVLVAIAAWATELTLTSAGQAILPRLAVSVVLLGWVLGIYTFLKARADQESSQSPLTVVTASVLITALWGFDILRSVATTERLTPELVMVVLLRAALLSFVATAGNAVCLRISGGLTVALMLFASVLTEQRAIYGLTFAYALLGSYWLILLYWSQIQVKLLEGRSKPPPILAITVWGLMTGLLITLVVGPRQTIGVLGESLGTSGGTTVQSPDARGGVGDGQDLASGTENARSSGPVDSDIFLETKDKSLYDAANEKWGLPEKPKKNDLSLAVALPNQADGFREEKSKQPNPTREFSVVRKRRRDGAAPPTLESNAAYFVKGKTPLHIRLAAFEEFDGRRWIEPALQADSEGLRLGFGGWILLPDFPSSIVAGDPWHKIVVGSIDAPQIPMPPYTYAFRIDRVDRPDFFRFSQPGILIYRINTALPRQTVLETRSHTIDPQSLRKLRFPVGQLYARPAFLKLNSTDVGSTNVSVADDRPPVERRIRDLASSWSGGAERGWSQVEAVVNRLREDYEYDPRAVLPADASDAVSGFLFDQRRGDDYAFATAACLLLRSLGYPCRFVEGLYAHPRKFDPKTQQTPIQMPGDLHTWVEVMLPNHEWIVVEPTPGFEVLGPEQGTLARLAGIATKLIAALRQHPRWGMAFALLLVGSISAWRRIGMACANCAWWLEFRGSRRARLLATVRLLERRARLAGLRRPLGVTLRGWYCPVAARDNDEASRRTLIHFLGIAEWALYGSSDEPVTPGFSDDEVESRCREFVRTWPAARLAPPPRKAETRMRYEILRGALISRVLLVFVVVPSLGEARGQMESRPTDRGTDRRSAPQIALPNLPESVWAESASSDVSQFASQRSTNVNRQSQRAGISGVRGIEEIPEMSVAERVNEHTMQAMTALFFFAIGASVGSFLNVVVYRLPRGIGLWGRRSHCPLCQADLSFRDNMPIIGWLRLRGRCKNCRAPISARYPSVEAITGLLFLVLLQVELLSGGKSIPIRTPNAYAGVVWIIWYPKWDLIALYLYHCFILCTLLCVALIRKDGKPVPWSLILAAALVGLASPMAVPSLHPVPAVVPGPTWFSAGDFRVGEIVTAAAGLATGMSLGGLILLSAHRDKTKAYRRGMPVVLGLVGLYLGWQAALSITLLTAAMQLLYVAISSSHAPHESRLDMTVAAVAAVVQIAFWRPLFALASGSSNTAGPGQIGICVFLIALLGFATRFLHPRSPSGLSAHKHAFAIDESTST
jgi:protein-glutamine gamma-glutamyltransferase